MGTNMTKNTPSNSNPALESMKEYIVDVQKGKAGKTVVILLSGTTTKDGEAIKFVDRYPLEIAKRELERVGYSIITLNTPCSVRCLDEYKELGVLITELGADAVIFKGIHSDLGTDSLNNILQKFNIPIYSYGSEIVLDYALYTGPDNIAMGKAVANGLKDKVKEGDSAIYIETNTVLNKSNILDNGYDRINSVRKELTKIGIKEAATIATMWSRTRTYEEISRILNNNKEIDYIIAPSIETGLGAAEAVERLNYPNIKVIAMDFTEEGVKLLKEGKFYGLISQELSNQGIALADSIMAGDLPPKTKKLFSSDTLITLENLNDYKLTSKDYMW